MSTQTCQLVIEAHSCLLRPSCRRTIRVSLVAPRALDVLDEGIVVVGRSPSALTVVFVSYRPSQSDTSDFGPQYSSSLGLATPMMPPWIAVASSIGMAVGPPLVYADQAVSIVRKRDSTGFSRDVCAILLIANIARCFFWLGVHFEFALLLQSVLMIVAQLALLFICLRYRRKTSTGSYAPSPRPFSFWQWSSYTQYIECLAIIMLCSAIIFLILGRSELYISILGFFALGLESTLPLPQFISNYKRKSLYGFRASTMIGWVGGDAFKTAYFFLRGFSLQFKACAIFQLSVDTAIMAQRLYYGNTPPPSSLLDGSDLEEALNLAEA